MSSHSNSSDTTEETPALPRKKSKPSPSVEKETDLKAKLGNEHAQANDCTGQPTSCAENNSADTAAVNTAPTSLPTRESLTGMMRQEPSHELGVQSVAIPVVALILLAVVAVVLGRRRKTAGQRVRILESTSLGPKRSLVVAQMGNETLLIGSSESGLYLLAARPSVEAPSEAQTEAPHGEKRSENPEVSTSTTTASPPAEMAKSQPKNDSRNEASENLARLLSAASSQEDEAAAHFQSMLAESVEDQELRRKFAHGTNRSAR